MMVKITEGHKCRWIGTTNFCCNTVEYEDDRIGDFRLFRTTCQGQTYYSVADEDNNELGSFKNLESAKNDADERYAKILEYQADQEREKRIISHE